MTLLIETENHDGKLILRLIGRIQSIHLGELKTRMQGCAYRAVEIDLAEVTNVDVDTVRFLSDHERKGVQLLYCPPFVREWIQRERETEQSH